MLPQSPQQPKLISVDVPGLGTVEFPEGTAPEVMEKAIREATGWKPEDPTGGRSAASRAAGGFMNTSGLNPLPFIELGARMLFSPIETTKQVAKNLVEPLGRLGNVGDAFQKAGLTGAANEVAASIPIIGPMSEHASQRMKSGDVAGGVGEVGGMIFGGSVGPALLKGAITKAAPYTTRTAEGLMQSALKPGVARMRDVMRGKATVPHVVQTMLKEGVSVSDSGLGKINQLLNSKNTELRGIIEGSDATTNAAAIADRASGSRQGLATQATPLSDLRAFDDAIDEFVRVHGGTGIIKGGKPMSMADTQELKTGTYQNLESKDFGTVQHGAKEGQKALARGMKEEIEAGIPNQDVRGINRTIGDSMEVRDALGYRLGISKNRDPGGITPIAPTDVKFLAMLMLRNPAVKSMLARGLYQSAAKASKVPESVIRAAMMSVAGSDQLVKEPE